MNNQRILITGAGGFLGNRFSNQLIVDGVHKNNQIICTYREQKGQREIGTRVERNNPKRSIG